ncbi:MAG: hypothetical protein M3Z54_09200 [Gemmatimonadota bacterium]|nr:hypothetical protein [Gemmatimonadota bacterium]
MTDQPPEPPAGRDDDGTGNGAGSVSPDEGAPRWVKVFGAIALAFLLIVVAIHLAGGGFHAHGAQ